YITYTPELIISTPTKPVTISSFTSEDVNGGRNGNQVKVKFTLNDPDNVLVGQEAVTVKYSNSKTNTSPTMSATGTIGVQGSNKYLEVMVTSQFNQDWFINQVVLNAKPARALTNVGITSNTNKIYESTASNAAEYKYRVNLGLNSIANNHQNRITTVSPSDHSVVTTLVLKTNALNTNANILNTSINNNKWANLSNIKIKARFNYTNARNNAVTIDTPEVNLGNNGQVQTTLRFPTDASSTTHFRLSHLYYRINGTNDWIEIQNPSNIWTEYEHLKPSVDIYQNETNGFKALEQNFSAVGSANEYNNFPRNTSIDLIKTQSFTHEFSLNNVYLQNAQIDEREKIVLVFEESYTNQSNQSFAKEIGFELSKKTSNSIMSQHYSFTDEQHPSRHASDRKINLSVKITDMKAGYKYRLKRFYFKTNPTDRNGVPNLSEVNTFTFNFDNPSQNTINSHGTIKNEPFYPAPLVPWLLEADTKISTKEVWRSIGPNWIPQTTGVYADKFIELQTSYGWGKILEWLNNEIPNTPKVFTYNSDPRIASINQQVLGQPIQTKYTLKELWIQRIAEEVGRYYALVSLGKNYRNAKIDGYNNGHAVYLGSFYWDDRYSLSSVSLGFKNVSQKQRYGNFYDPRRNPNDIVFEYAPVLGGKTLHADMRNNKFNLNNYRTMIESFMQQATGG
ncbi:hypothetical protein OF377_03260, partial [Ureaplasma sp. ES3154-GEN]|uniref:hypothetical protein n=1 Tax=Ureaplasma sp. ES3154-GEN TaxID=2984844 RepID=UPI0021E8CBA7